MATIPGLGVPGRAREPVRWSTGPFPGSWGSRQRPGVGAGQGGAGLCQEAQWAQSFAGCPARLSRCSFVKAPEALVP